MNLAHLFLSVLLGWRSLNGIGVITGLPDEPALQLSTTLVGQQYCVGDQDVDLMSLKLRLHYTNYAPTPIILHKDSNLILRTIVSPDLEAAAAGRFDSNVSTFTLTAQSANIGGPTPGEEFAILAPNRSYDTEATAQVFVMRNAAKPIAGVIRPGACFADTGRHLASIQ